MPKALHREVGQLAIVGFEGTTLPAELRSLARRFDLGGVILFARNVQAPEQVADLAHDVQQLSRDLPLWVSIDQEGGRVARLRAPFTEWPPMATLGRSGDEALARRFAAALAAELRVVGISLDYAPVLDVHTNPANSVIGDRALGRRSDVVARLGAVIIRTLQGAGVAACGKHFPGHGDTSADSHLELPVVEHPPDRLRAVELEPFRAAIDAEVASIMTAHVLIPALDDERPASLSRAIVHDLLRVEMKYGGLIISDDLEMRAVAASSTLEKAAVAAVAAGCDAVLLCGTDQDRQVSAIEAIVHAVEAEELSGKAVEESLERHRRAKTRFAARGAVHEAAAAGPSSPAQALVATLGSPLERSWRPPSREQLGRVLGADEHRRVADLMSQFL
jgi:beta-N-acetylhexosaminidase